MKLKTNKKKFEIFLEAARELNDFFNVVPILSGSLGLYRIIGEHGESHDIDILVPDEFVNKRWNELTSLMKKIGFKLNNEHEHEFIRGFEIVAFATKNDLKEQVNLDPNSLGVSNFNNIKFKELAVENYLSLYKLMLRDSYRQEKKGREDKIKINLIKKYISKT